MAVLLPYLLVVLCPLSAPVQEQEVKPIFGCTKAVEISINRKPPFHWEPVPDKAFVGFTGSETHSFIFSSQWPFSQVTFYLAATIGEESVGSTAELSIYAVSMSASPSGGGNVEKVWRLVREDKPDKAGEHSGPSLRFDAKRVGECFRQRSTNGACSFADIEQAAPKDDIPFFDVSFSEDLGGANASNTTTTHLLLDFRAATPTVAVTGECAYNEGGGACTAFDSAEMNRSDLACEWAPDRRDFVCREKSDTGHRSFYLIGNGIAPVSGEDGSLADAVTKLSATAPDHGVTVRGIGEVRIITRMPLPNGSTDLLVGAPDKFYLASGHSDARLIRIGVHGLTNDTGHQPKAPEEVSPPEPAPLDETPDEKASYSVRTLYADRPLTVFQVVVKTTFNRLYWIGVENVRGRTVADAIELVGAAHSYKGCGVELIPETVARISRITRPFRAAVEVQPPTETSAEEDIAWEGNHFSDPDQQPIINCTRDGTLVWRKGSGFVAGTASHSTCGKAAKPHFITVTDSGDIKISDKLTP